ncbi:MAG: ribosome silencing factor [Methylococcales symbiont of Hymedesmia sp. n. MRB-2018]|nr:MAG: ribosome silencing factor [Methylococcales symbiont of Hymedesmia sp. n. MRB-2018]KAF3983131.1 MAG: ribosome silencing factor [Methylococcales symbiont of Hymedesmia sp. n. MRB-2018]
MQTKKLLKMIEAVLNERKGQNITVIDVQGKTSVTDYMMVVTSTSERHAKALCNYVLEKTKENSFTPLGVEGDQGSDWVLLDLGDVILHIFTAQAREFYQLEKLWSIERSKEQSV